MTGLIAMMDPKALQEYLASRFPEARIAVSDITGTRDHFEIEVVSASFEGQSALERHRRVHAILAPLMERDIHAVRLRTRTPGEESTRRHP